MTEVRATSTYAGNEPAEVRARLADRPAERAGPGDLPVRAHRLRRPADRP
ncbi:hypothetical protein [Streptomyces sp. NPDC093105]